MSSAQGDLKTNSLKSNSSHAASHALHAPTPLRQVSHPYSRPLHGSSQQHDFVGSPELSSKSQRVSRSRTPTHILPTLEEIAHSSTPKNINSLDSQHVLKAFFSLSSTLERQRALQSLVEMCAPLEAAFLDRSLRKRHWQARRDVVAADDVPDELTMLIFSHLDARSLAKASMVCQRWHRLAQDPSLWKRICGKSGILATSFSKVETGNVNSNDIWYVRFRENELVRLNWRHGHYTVRQCAPFKEDKTLHRRIHASFDADGRVVSLSHNAPAAIWCSNTGRRLVTLHGQVGLLATARYDGNYVVGGGRDSNVYVWNSKSGQLLHSLRGHEGDIACVHFGSDLVASGSEDGTLRVWNLQTGDPVQVFRHPHPGNVSAICCILILDNDIIVSGSTDASVTFWRISTGTRESSLRGHTGNVFGLHAYADILVSGSADKSVRLWSISKHSVTRVLRGHVDSVIAVQCDATKIVSGSCDHTIKVWQIQTGQCLFTLAGHRASIWQLRLEKTQLYSSAMDHSVMRWDFNSESHPSKRRDSDYDTASED